MSRPICLSLGGIALSTAVSLLLALPLEVQAQQGSAAPTTTQQKPTTPDEADGPQGDIGPYAIPKKKDESSTPPPPPPKPKTPEGMPSYSISVDVPSVNLDVM